MDSVVISAVVAACCGISLIAAGLLFQDLLGILSSINRKLQLIVDALEEDETEGD